MVGAVLANYYFEDNSSIASETLRYTFLQGGACELREVPARAYCIFLKRDCPSARASIQNVGAVCEGRSLVFRKRHHNRSEVVGEGLPIAMAQDFVEGLVIVHRVNEDRTVEEKFAALEV